MRHWHKILLYAVILATVLKVWLPDQIQISAHGWDQIVHKLLPLFNNQSQAKNPSRVQKGIYKGMVMSVHDGDTIRVRDTDGQIHKIRLSNIDAPELKQAYGTASRDALSSRINKQTVEVNVIDIDRYQREVGQIMFQQQDINLWMLRQGYAWHYVSIAKKQQNPLAYTQYQRAQSLAQQQRLGLWYQYHPIAPWQFRQQVKNR